jgi:hypothetical protein
MQPIPPETGTKHNAPGTRIILYELTIHTSILAKHVTAIVSLTNVSIPSIRHDFHDSPTWARKAKKKIISPHNSGPCFSLPLPLFIFFFFLLVTNHRSSNCNLTTPYWQYKLGNKPLVIRTVSNVFPAAPPHLCFPLPLPCLFPSSLYQFSRPNQICLPLLHHYLLFFPLLPLLSLLLLFLFTFSSSYKNTRRWVDLLSHPPHKSTVLTANSC